MFRNMAGDSVQLTEIQQPAQGEAKPLSPGHRRIWIALLFGCSLLARLYFAGFLFLDPDEALHYWVSVQTSIAAAYHATLSTAHPPLFILLLYCWRGLGHSEIMLRLPGILGGLAFCWITYKWMARLAHQRTAEIALPLLLFTPSLMWVSAEVRQYWLLLLFISLALYCFERAAAEQSLRWMIGFTLALDFALASHYSSLLFALTMGIYALIRLGSIPGNRKLLAACALGQLSALTEVGIFFKTHISLLKRSGLPQEIADTWLRKSIFHPAEDHVISFLARDTIRLFRYLFGNGIVGAVALAVFALGMFLVFRKRGDKHIAAATCRQSAGRPSPPRRGRGGLSTISGQALGPAAGLLALRNFASDNSTALLIVLPFAITVLAALAGVYPYGGTRHDLFLAPFAILAISIALTFWKIRPWIRSAAILFVMALANIFPSPAGPFIKPGDHSKSRMASAMAALRKNPPGSVIFTDYEGGLMLSYYLCGHAAVQVVPPYQPFSRSSCGQLYVIAEAPSGSVIGQEWMFRASDFAQKSRQVVSLYGLQPDADLIIFRAGWTVKSDVELLNAFATLGCNAPERFGRNVLLCRIRPHRLVQ
jgi:hypothetical protein